MAGCGARPPQNLLSHTGLWAWEKTTDPVALWGAGLHMAPRGALCSQEEATDDRIQDNEMNVHHSETRGPRRQIGTGGHQDFPMLSNSSPSTYGAIRTFS